MSLSFLGSALDWGQDTQAQDKPTPVCPLHAHSVLSCQGLTPVEQITEHRLKALSPALPLTSLLPAGPSGERQSLFLLSVSSLGVKAK